MNKNLIAVIVVVVLGVAGWYVWKSMSGSEEMSGAVDMSDPATKAIMDAFRPTCEQNLKTAMAANPSISEGKIPGICDCMGGKLVEVLKQNNAATDSSAMMTAMAGQEFMSAMQACMAQ